MKLHKTTFDFNDLFWDWFAKEYDEDREFDNTLSPYKYLPINPYQLNNIPLIELNNYRQIIAEGPHEWFDGKHRVYTYIE